jgi:hypothetical protein
LAAQESPTGFSDDTAPAENSNAGHNNARRAISEAIFLTIANIDVILKQYVPQSAISLSQKNRVFHKKNSKQSCKTINKLRQQQNNVQGVVYVNQHKFSVQETFG